MPTKTLTATVTIASTAGQFLPTAVTVTTAKSQIFNKDSSESTLVISPSTSQSLYVPEENNPIVYIFVKSAETNNSGSGNELALVHSDSTGSRTIGSLKPGDWSYFPYSGSMSTRLMVRNLSSTTAASVLVLYAESGSEA